MDDQDENLLLRWSRRKHEARQGKPVAATPTAPAEPAPGTVPPSQEAVAASSEPVAAAQDQVPAETVKPEDLPDVETLTYDSDFSPFMREGVPEFLKKQALRKLWLSNPVFANLDGLNDYDPISMKFFEALENPADVVVGEVGRGLRDKIMDAKRAREERPRGRRTPERRSNAAAEPSATETNDEQEAGQNSGGGQSADSKRFDA
jgi:Protein of unknown function (DUF3306)